MRRKTTNPVRKSPNTLMEMYLINYQTTHFKKLVAQCIPWGAPRRLELSLLLFVVCLSSVTGGYTCSNLPATPPPPPHPSNKVAYEVIRTSSYHKNLELSYERHEVGSAYF
jgi:hypothetical protein